MTDIVDAVAQAIRLADPEMDPLESWDELDPGDWGCREDYRRMARAAIDASDAARGLAYETAPRWTEDSELCPCGSGNKSGHYKTHIRLVSPWARAEGNVDE